MHYEKVARGGVLLAKYLPKKLLSEFCASTHSCGSILNRASLARMLHLCLFVYKS